MDDLSLREHLLKALDGEQAHVGFDKSVEGISEENRGRIVPGIPYSAWQIVEHIRLAQYDIINFCMNPRYEEPRWPDDYWPSAAGPSGPDEWEQSLARFRQDLSAFREFIANPGLNLFDNIPHGSGQTYLREAILIVDHNAYHLGQLVLLRRVLGNW